MRCSAFQPSRSFPSSRPTGVPSILRPRRYPARTGVPRSCTAIVGFATAAFALALATRPAAEETPPQHGIGAEIDLEDARELFLSGRYPECAEAAAAAAPAVFATQATSPGGSGGLGEAWRVLELRSRIAVGDHEGAVATFEAAVRESPASIQLRWYGRLAFLFHGETIRAEGLLQEMEILIRNASWRYRDPENRTIVGRFLLLRGADARAVLEEVYDPIKKDHPDFVGAAIASGDLALEKGDFAVAAEEFARALRIAPDDPDALFGRARAVSQSDLPEAQERLQAVLARNPNHVPSLLHLVDSAIDRESYEDAGELIERVLDIDPRVPTALAYRAVVRHLEGDGAGEAAARAAALAGWSGNAGVDHLIGRKLSQKYRFAEGSAYQKRALGLERGHLPSLLQLGQDLLRLGRDEEGWRLAREVYERDGYNVVAHNLSVLREHIAGFSTLEAEGLVLRMDPREAAAYGDLALELLVRARETLARKYDVELPGRVVVEIFPEQKDFAIRTFGLPGGAGFLAVCFGNVITANSPASQGARPANWQAVLWHEFCHVVTLRKTRNRMPRWLSEGISVYEERRENPAWGQTMTPRYLELVEGGAAVPVSRLSGAFLDPPSPLHLEFAYYQSSLVVEILIERHGFETLLAILDDLAEGRPINGVLERRTGSLEALERAVEEAVKGRAADLAAKADWAEPAIPPGAGLDALAAWTRENPRNYRGLQRHAARLAAEGRWAEAKGPLEQLVALCPECAGPDGAHALLAKIHRELSDTEAEREALRLVVERDADALDAALRLAEICAGAGDWEGTARAAVWALAVNPLLKAPHRDLIRASETLGARARAIGSYRALLAMDPVDPADLHLGLARALRDQGKLREAKLHVLEAIEEAPRFREAHRELLALVELLGEPPGEGKEDP